MKRAQLGTISETFAKGGLEELAGGGVGKFGYENEFVG